MIYSEYDFPQIVKDRETNRIFKLVCRGEETFMKIFASKKQINVMHCVLTSNTTLFFNEQEMNNDRIELNDRRYNLKRQINRGIQSNISPSKLICLKWNLNMERNKVRKENSIIKKNKNQNITIYPLTFYNPNSYLTTDPQPGPSGVPPSLSNESWAPPEICKRVFEVFRDSRFQFDSDRLEGINVFVPGVRYKIIHLVFA